MRKRERERGCLKKRKGERERGDRGQTSSKYEVENALLVQHFFFTRFKDRLIFM